MYSPIVLEAYDALVASSPVYQESETSLEVPQTAPITTLIDETSDVGSDYDCDPATKRHWYLHTRRWRHQQAANTSNVLSEQLKALLSPVVYRPGKTMDKASAMKVEIECVEVVESTA